MEDKEAQEKIAEARLAYILLNWRENFDNTMMTVQELARKLMDVLTEEFGYRRPGELLEEINLDDVESMSHFGVVRDWVFKLKDGRKIILGANIVKTIVEHENEELGQPGKLLSDLVEWIENTDIITMISPAKREEWKSKWGSDK